MQEVWSKRFLHYIEEVQKYMRFIFTGHIGLVLVFVIGAGGYQYSEWLKVAPQDFPAEWLVAIIVGILVAFSTPVTLLKEPDQVYLLPLETQMPHYFKRALNWTFFSQFLVPVVVYIVSIPLLNAVTALTTTEKLLGLFVVIVLKYLNVHMEFHYRYGNRGALIWLDRFSRMAMSILVLEMLLNTSYFGLVLLVIMAYYNFVLAKRIKGQPLPYEHFIKVEQNRMMRFYRFANYFTDVPHLRGSVKRRAWLDIIYKWIPFTRNNTQLYLVWRTFIRTDDHFYLWVRLTAISAVIALFVDILVVTWIVAGALAFATAIQLKYALLSSSEFRMDMLYPVPSAQRPAAVQKLIRTLMIVQAIIVALCQLNQPLFFVTPILIIIVGEVTLRMAKGK